MPSEPFQRILNEILLISQSSFLCRVARCVEGTLVEYREEHRHSTPDIGALLRGRIVRSLESLEAVLVDYGGAAPGFLPLDEVTPEALSVSGTGAMSSSTLRAGHEILVQITKAPQGKKGARLTGKFSLPGRYWVFLPCATPEVLIARRLGGKATRARLREEFSSVLEEKGAWVLRSSACLEDLDALNSELRSMRALWGEITERATGSSVGEALHRDHRLPLRALREQVGVECTQILVDDSSIADAIHGVVDQLYPELRGKVVLSPSSTNLFEYYGIDAALARAGQRSISLPEGGSVVFDETEALTVVDVNAGNPGGSGSREDAHLAINLEAAKEVALQIRLRDITGLVVIDFINLRSPRARDSVEKALQDGLREDPVQNEVLPMSRFGLVQIMRSEGRRTSHIRTREACTHCHGRGMVPTDTVYGTRALHQIERLFAQPSVCGVEVEGNKTQISYFAQEFREAVDGLSTKFHKRIVLCPAEDYHSREYSLKILTSHDDRPAKG